MKILILSVLKEVKSDHRSKFSNFKQLERRSLKKSGLQRDSNPWPPRYRCDALPTELWSHTLGARSIYWVHIFPCSEVMWSIYETIHICTAVVDEVKSDHRSKFSNFKQLERRSLKKSGSTNWAMQPHIGSEVNFYWVLIFPCSEVMWSIYEIIHICTAVVDEVKSDHRIKFSNFKQLERRTLQKSGLQRDSNPWTPRYRCDAHWAMKPHIGNEAS